MGCWKFLCISLAQPSFTSGVSGSKFARSLRFTVASLSRLHIRRHASRVLWCSFQTVQSTAPGLQLVTSIYRRAIRRHASHVLWCSFQTVQSTAPGLQLVTSIYRVAQATALPSGGGAEAPFGVVAVADRVLKTEHSSGYCTAASAASMYTAVYMCGVITCQGSTAQQQSAFTLEAGPTRETTACVNVAGPGWASPEKRSRPAHGWKGRPRNWQRSARWYQVFFFVLFFM